MTDLPALLSLFQKFLEKNGLPETPRELYEPCAYILKLGGKRIRPALVLMGFDLFAEVNSRAKFRKALPAAAAVELFHNFTLMHDDIMDAAPLRRGQVTVHQRFGTNAAILSGDAMLILAYQFLEKAGSRRALPELLRVFNRTAREVCEGQQLDMNFETRPDVSLPEYLTMIEWKTAVLLGAALQLGAICAGAPTAEAERLFQVGRLAGLAFQIQDDYLDTFGDPVTFGKQVGGDILQNKKTWLVLKTLEVAAPSDRAELANWLKTNDVEPEKKVAAVRAIFERCAIPRLAEAEIERHYASAMRHLGEVEVLAERKLVLKNTLGSLLHRSR